VARHLGKQNYLCQRWEIIGWITFAIGASAAPPHWELISDATIALASAAVPRTRLSDGMFCNIGLLSSVK
jgi:hypothetical protein